MRRLTLSRSFRSLAAVLTVSSAGFALYACGGGDDDGGNADGGGSSSPDGTAPGSDATVPGSDATTPGSDATTASGDDGSPASDGSMPLVDGSAPDTDSATDAGTVGPLGSCGTPFIVDTSPSAIPQSVWAESFNGKWIIGWGQNVTPSHMRARYFDGTTMTPEIDLGPIVLDNAFSAVDTSGVAYVLGVGASNTTFRSGFDLVAGQPLATSNVASRIGDGNSYSVASLPHGALAAYQAAPLAEVGDLYTPDAGWSYQGGTTDAGLVTVDSTTTFTHVALNAAGKGAASWADTITGNARRLYVAAFDGTKLSAPVTRDFPSATSGAASYFDSVALANGDVAFAWATASLGGVTFATFHVASGTWDADMTIDTFSSNVQGTAPRILADADDDLTILWARPSEDESRPLVAIRRVAGTWGSILNVGYTSLPVRAAVDPNGNVVVAANTAATVASVTRIAAKGTTFDPLVATGLPTVNDQPALGIVFSANGEPTLFDFGQYDGGTHVVAVNCVSMP